MPLTRKFRTTLFARAQRDEDFRQAMLQEGIDALLEGDVASGKAILRDYINAAVGFRKLAAETKIPEKSLMRMFGPKGNPRADRLFHILHKLQVEEGVHLGVSPR